MSNWGFAGLGNRYLEFPPVTETPKVSPPGRTRIIYNSNTGQLERSDNGAAYTALALAFGPSWLPNYIVHGNFAHETIDTVRISTLTGLNPFSLTSGLVTVNNIYFVSGSTVTSDPADFVAFELDAVNSDGSTVVAMTADFNTNTTSFVSGVSQNIAVTGGPFDLSATPYIRLTATKNGSGQNVTGTVLFDCTYASS